MAESLGNVMPTNAFLPRSSAPHLLCSFLSARFSDSFTVVLDDLLLICVYRKVFRF
jgi:hypothetical protein